MIRKRRFVLFTLLLLFLLAGVYAAYAWDGLAVDQDPLIRFPGTQPGQVSLESSNRCLNCHAGYNTVTEPGFNWEGSMMAQAARDFLFWSCMVVAAQDSIWAVGRPNATDICERCHFPEGWLEGRSDPTNASLMTGSDYDGLHCDFCHRMYDPFFETALSREGTEDPAYWDEPTSPSGTAAQETHDADALEAGTIELFNGQPFFLNSRPFSESYLENGSGQYFVSSDADKRASFVDAEARHRMLYSRYHKSRYFCSTCHDVSNPVLANLGADTAFPLPTETDSAYSYLHVERTFSEFMLSDYGQVGGSSGIGPFDPSVFQTSNVDNAISKCQDCHLRDVVGRAADKRGVPLRPEESTDHPESGQPLHDMTGGNVWVSTVLASAIPGSPNYDPLNETLLNQGPAILTLDLSQGQGVDPVAMLAGADRARQQLRLAASVENVDYDSATGDLSFTIQNQTGHKLISGFPEGRRMFINIRAYQGGLLIYEVNPYDRDAGTLKGLDIYTYNGLGLPGPAVLGSSEVYSDALVYELHPSSSLTGEQETFHFALADGRYKDNRIPPKGFDIIGAPDRLVVPVWHGAELPDYFSAEEYAGGFDDVALAIPAGADVVEINLYYQTTSREYIEFLRDEINGQADSLSSPTNYGDPEAYVVQTDPFFTQLNEWGNTIWDLWLNNMNVDGAAPFLMAQSTYGALQSCEATSPTLLAADPGQKQVSLSWSDEHSENANVISYTVYYDQADKAQWVAELGQVTAYVDTNLTNGQYYCYKVTSQSATCESDFSTVKCATPTGVQTAGVASGDMESGFYTGKGQKAVFNPSQVFVQGDGVVIRIRITDSGGLPVSGASVEITIDGPESHVIVSGQSDIDGWAEATWNTKRPKRGQAGTTQGDYVAIVTNLSSSTHNWDGFSTLTTFTIN